MVGSSFPHGFHASHLWKSFTCANSAGAGAEMVALRTTPNSEGCSATMTTNTTTMIATAMRIFMSIVYLLLLQAAPKRLRGEAREKSTSGGVLHQYVVARRLSATKHMSLFGSSLP